MAFADAAPVRVAHIGVDEIARSTAAAQQLSQAAQLGDYARGAGAMGSRVDGADRLAARGLRPGGAGPRLMGTVAKRQTRAAFRCPACRPLRPAEFGFQRIDRAGHFSFSMSSIVKFILSRPKGRPQDRAPGVARTIF